MGRLAGFSNVTASCWSRASPDCTDPDLTRWPVNTYSEYVRARRPFHGMVGYGDTDVLTGFGDRGQPQHRSRARARSLQPREAVNFWFHLIDRLTRLMADGDHVAARFYITPGRTAGSAQRSRADPICSIAVGTPPEKRCNDRPPYPSGLSRRAMRLSCQATSYDVP
jgi:hypothetical protein